MTRLSKSKFFRIMMKIGCIGFGGGNALIPLIQKELVEETKVVKSDDFDEDVVVASITPGALPVEIAGGVGSRLFGFQGMLLGAVGMALPGVLLNLAFLSCLSELEQNINMQIRFFTVGISAYIVCLLMDYVASSLHRAKNTMRMAHICLVIGIVFLLTCGKTLNRLLENSLTPLFCIGTIHIFAAAFFLIFCLHERRGFWRQAIATTLCIAYILCVSNVAFLQIPLIFYMTVVIMLLFVMNSIWYSIPLVNLCRMVSINEIKEEVLSLGIYVLFFFLPALCISSNALIYVGSSILSSLMSFGGGDAYLTVADGLFVETSLITEDEFYGTIVPLVNLLPGSILCKTISGIGYLLGYDASGSVGGGLMVAGTGFAVSLATSCGVFAVVRYIYRKYHQFEVFQTVQRMIRPIVSGLLLTVALELFFQARKFGVDEGMGWEPAILMFVLSVIDGWLYFVRQMENVKVLLVSCSVALIVCNFTYIEMCG